MIYLYQPIHVKLRGYIPSNTHLLYLDYNCFLKSQTQLKKNNRIRVIIKVMEYRKKDNTTNRKMTFQTRISFSSEETKAKIQSVDLLYQKAEIKSIERTKAYI